MSEPPPNITLIVVDCLREDHAGPLWKALEPFGFRRYERVISASNWTVPSHASMLTGMYPSAHGARETKENKILEATLDPRLETAVGRVREEGYEVNWFTANVLVTPSFGFPRPDRLELVRNFPAFSLDNKESPDGKKQNFLVRGFRSALASFINFLSFFWFNSGFIRKTVMAAWTLLVSAVAGVRWPLDKGAKKLLRNFKSRLRGESGPYLNYVNFMEVHEPYEGLDMFKISGSREVKRLKKEYRRGVRVVTPVLKRMVSFLEKNSENNLIVVVSDHGQLLGENRNIFYHLYGTDEELLRVPLFIKFPEGVRANGGEGWISLTRIRELLERASRGELKEDGFLYSGTAFAETFSLPIEARKVLETSSMSFNHRIAVYSKDSKGVYDTAAGQLESLTHFGGERAGREELEAKARGFLELNGPAGP